MEDFLISFVKFHWKKNKLFTIFQLLLLFLLFAGVTFAIWYLCCDKQKSDIWDLYANLLASLLAFICAYYVVVGVARSLHRYEDELKVSYKNSDMEKIYGKDSPYYLHFPLHEKDKQECVVYCDKLFLASECPKGIEIIDHPREHFQLDAFIQSQTLKLKEAHSQSKTEVSLTVRLSDFAIENGKAVLTTSRSTYLNHLLTNRALDYPITPDISIRSLYEQGKRLMPLLCSKMSNHLGINAIVFLKNENGAFTRLILPKRGESATVVKNGVTASIATRLKMDMEPSVGNFDKQYESVLTEEYILRGCIIDNIQRALLLTSEGAQKVQEASEIKFLGLARDPYEGGKPTLFYMVKIDMTQKEFEGCKDKNYQPEGIDAIEQLLYADWSELKIKKPNTDNARLVVNGKPYIFEQNLMANFWFYTQQYVETQLQ